jgi:hypothetical protein
MGCGPDLAWSYVGKHHLLGNEHSMGKCLYLGASGRRGDGGEEPADIVASLIGMFDVVASLLSVLLLLQSLPLSLPHRHYH